MLWKPCISRIVEEIDLPRNWNSGSASQHFLFLLLYLSPQVRTKHMEEAQESLILVHTSCRKLYSELYKAVVWTIPGHCSDYSPPGSWSEKCCHCHFICHCIWLTFSCVSAPRDINPPVVNPEQTCLAPLDWVLHRFPPGCSVIIE
jgi:hypothetical protein